MGPSVAGPSRYSTPPQVPTAMTEHPQPPPLDPVAARAISQLPAAEQAEIWAARFRHEARIAEAVRTGDFDKALALAGRNRGPTMFFEWWEEGILDLDQLRALLPVVWSMAEYPERQAPTELWVELFEVAGFISDTGQPRPAAPLTIYRGAGDEMSARGMSWTTDLALAEWFGCYRRKGHVYVTTVEPDAVLALIDAVRTGREEQGAETEVVVHPDRFGEITRFGTT